MTMHRGRWAAVIVFAGLLVSGLACGGTLSPSPQPASGRVISRGSIVQDRAFTESIDLWGADIWSYESPGDEYISVEVVALDSWDPTLEIFDPAGSSTAYNDDSNGLDPALNGVYLPAPGLYEIRVDAYSGSGRYEITLRREETPNSGTLSYEETVQGRIDWQGERDEWAFAGQAGEAARISMVGWGGLQDTYLELYGPSGELLMQDDDSGGNLQAMIRDYPLPEDGTYRIVARAYSGDTGPYELTLNQVAVQEQMLVYGQTISGDLGQVGERDYWLFEGETGDVVTIWLVGQATLHDTFLELYSPSGELLMQDDDSGGNLQAMIRDYQLPEDGTYRIAARAYGGDTGPYELTLGQVMGNYDRVLTYITYGQTLPGDLSEPGMQEHWFFEGEADDVVTISMVGQGSLEDTFLELYGPDGSLLADNNDGGQGIFALIEDFVLPETGTYQIVTRASGSEVGPYTLALSGQ